MEKLLHERLRECADRCVDEIRVNDVVVSPLWPSEFNALADEIERYYIPQARDQEGKPWKIGDPVITSNCGETTVTGFIWDGVEWLLRCRWAGRNNEISDFARMCKRPTPKVLDADGVPLVSDDTAYGTGREQHRYTVQEPYSINPELGERFCVQCYDHDEGNIVWCDPSLLTHREPDSLEKLHQFAVDHAAYADGCSERDAFLEIADRLTAFIESGA